MVNDPVNLIDPFGLEGNVIGKIWNAPNTAIGVVWGVMGVLFGADVSIGNNVIQFTNHPFMSGAITIGNTICYGKGLPPNKPLRNGAVAEHELQHTLQGEQLGPLYLPSNLLGGAASEIVNGDWHSSVNWNESGPQSKPPSSW